MKKLLLSLLAVAGLSFAASAEEVTFDFSDPSTFGYTAPSKLGNGVDYSTPLKMGEVTITVDTKTAATGGGKMRFWYPTSGNPDFRCSATGGKKNQTLTFTADGGDITKIEFTAAKFALKADVGTLGAYANKKATWEGNATEVVFTTTDACTFNSIVVTYVPAGNPDLQPAGLKYETTSYNVELGEAFTAPDLINPNGLTVAYSSSKPEVATVNATTGTVEIVGAGTTTITAKSEETATYNAGSASYTITVTAPVETIASVAATKELASKTEFKVGYELTVAFKNYSNVFACDAAGDFIQIYGSNSYNIGDKIPAGWTGEYVLYNGNTPEIKPVGNLPEGEAGTFTPAVVSATAISTELVNSVVTINNVELEAATPGEDVTDSNAKNFTGTVDGTTLNFRNNYKLASVEAGTYNITVVVTVYQNEPSLYVTNFEKVTPTGINGIFVEENAPVEYYNLQGVRVANPENGLYIRRQGNKATKVLVK